MLQSIRENVQGTAAKIIVILIAIPFVFFGVESLFGGSTQTPVAVVNGEKISENELQQALNFQKRQLLAMMGENADPSLLDDALLRGPALDSLVREKLMLGQASELGLAAGDKQLNSVIVAMPQFQVDGKFSNERYQQLLRSQGYSGAMFKDLLSADVKKAQLRAAYASGFLAPQQEKLFIDLAEQRRSYNYLTITAAKLAQSTSIPDEEVKAYFDANQGRFQSPEQVQISFIELKLEDLFEEVDEASIKAEYQREVDALEITTQRKAAHILVELDDDTDRSQAMAKLAEARSELTAGKSFADVAAEYSDDIGSANLGGELGFTSGDTFPEAFEAALAQLQPGEVSQAVETDAGLHLIKLLELNRSEPPSYASRRADIARTMQERDARPALIRTVESLRDQVFNADGLAEPAKQLGLKVQRSGWLSAESPVGLMANETLRNAAFSSELREQSLNSEVVELSPQHYAVLHVESYKAPEPLPFDAVKAEIAAELKQQKAAEKAKTAAAEATAAIAEGKTVEAVAAELGVDWQAVVLETRSGGNVPAVVRKLAFEMAAPGEGGVTVANRAAGQASYVVSLSKVESPDLSSMSTSEKASVQRRAQASVGSQNFSAFYNSLRQQANIKIN